MTKSQPKSWKRKLVDAGANGAVYAVKRAMNSRSQTSTRTPNRNPANIVTSQLDVRATRKKKANLKTLRKERRFKEKIEKALSPDQELNVYSETSLVSLIPSVAVAAAEQQQYVCSANLMLNAGQSYSNLEGTGWIHRRFQNLIASNNLEVTEGAKSIIRSNSFKLRFISSKMEISLTNRLTIPQVYDIYECVAARDLGQNDALWNTPLNAWKQCLLDVYTPTDATPIVPQRPVVQTTGQTPYDCPSFGRYWKILKKTRVLLPPGNTTETMIMGNKFRLDGEKFIGNFAVKGITKGAIIIGGIGDNSQGPTVAQTTGAVVTQKTWHFKYQLGESELPQRPTALVKINLPA